MSFTLSADTSCDILRNEMTARGIEYRPLVYTIDDVPRFDDFTKDEDYKAFYDQIRAGKMPTTSQINIVEHEEFFQSLLDKYEGDIVHITLSSGLSSTYASACKAAENICEKYGKRVYVVDSLGATIATRHVVDEAERLRDAGVGAAEAAEKLKAFVDRLQTWFMPTDLMHLKRGGRVSGPSAYIGTALNIKPIINFDKYGALAVVQKKMGAGKGITAMVDAFKRLSAKTPHKVYIASADSEFADLLLRKAKAVRPDCEFEIGWIGPVIGAHTGCNAVGLSFVSDVARS